MYHRFVVKGKNLIKRMMIGTKKLIEETYTDNNARKFESELYFLRRPVNQENEKVSQEYTART